jgi:hypothetical protein
VIAEYRQISLLQRVVEVRCHTLRRIWPAAFAQTTTIMPAVSSANQRRYYEMPIARRRDQA